MGVVAHQDVEGSERITRRGDELLAGRRLGEIAGQRHHTTRSGCSFADLLDQPVDVVGAAVLGEVVGCGVDEPVAGIVLRQEAEPGRPYRSPLRLRDAEDTPPF